MPTYEYECSKCKDIFEVFQSMKDDHIKKCPECGGKVKRLFGTGSGIIFKGSGFYETDYRSDNYQNEVKKEKSSSSTSSKPKVDKKSDGDSTKNGKKTKSTSSSESTKKSK